MNFKIPSNPGRLIVFSRLGLPVVADFIPSHFQFINHGVDSYIAYSSAGWFNSIEKLILNPDLRNSFSTKLQDKIYSITNYKKQNQRLNKFINSSILNKNN